MNPMDATERSVVRVDVAVVAGLFLRCIDCFQLVRRGAALSRKEQLLETQFNNEELRLAAWGRACGFPDGQLRDDRLKDPNLQEQIYAILECIERIFQDDQELQSLYGLESWGFTTQSSASPRSNQDVPSTALAHIGTFFSRKKQQRDAGFFGPAILAIGDWQKFAELIQYLKGFNTDLESITHFTGVPRRQRIIVEHEIEEVDDVEILKEIAETGQEEANIISDAATRRIRILQANPSPTQSIRASLDTRRSFHTPRESISIDFGPLPCLDLVSGLVSAEASARPAPVKPPTPTPQKLKCVAVGDRDSGKTQVLSAFAGRIKLGQYIPTVFDDYTMDCTVHENNKSRTVELGLFDTAGQEDYQKLLPLTFEKADVFVICFPADASIERMKESVKRKWLREISRVCPGVPFVIVAVHNDWDDADDIPGELLSINPEKRAQFSRDVGASGYFDIWPCTRIRVDDILTEVVGAAVTYNEAQKRWERPGKRRRRSILSRLLTIRE